MSEYQCYQWAMVRRGLSPAQRRMVSELSSHISVNAGSAMVEYHWGDFKHDPIEVLQRHFDVFVYEANWGTQQVAFRFDPGVVDADRLSDFVVEDFLQIRERKEGLLLEASFDENWVDPCCSVEHGDETSLLVALEGIHHEFTEGDYRGLFLLWLKACELSDPNDIHDAWIPNGMAQLTEDHQTLIDFIEVNGDILDQVAPLSENLPKKQDLTDRLHPHLSRLSDEKKNHVLEYLLQGQVDAAQSGLRRELTRLAGVDPAPKPGPGIAYADLATKAGSAVRAEQQRREAEKVEQRRKYLEELGRREDEIWDRVNDLVAGKTTKGYDEAVLLLRGLEDLWTSRDDAEHFLTGVRTVTESFPRLTGFRRRLQEPGWIEPDKKIAIMQHAAERWRERNPLEREIDFDQL